MTVRILVGDCSDRLRELPDESVQCVVTSPPYWGLRDYGVDDQLGLEPTPEQYVAKLVAVFREVRRVLRDDGVVWLNLGDSYCSTAPGTTNAPQPKGSQANPEQWANYRPATPNGLKPKDLVGIPWRVAFALQADGWWLRSDVIWHKPNPMPESVTDRPTKSHEYVFLLTKSARYFYDADAVREESITEGDCRHERADNTQTHSNGRNAHNSRLTTWNPTGPTRNRRTVWTIATHPFPGAHFATFPPALVEPCVMAGTSERGCCPECGSPWERVVERTNESNWEYRKEMGAIGGCMNQGPKQQIGAGRSHHLPSRETTTTGWRTTCDHDAEPVPCTVLDPFGGAGTVGLVADRLGRDAILIELNPDYAEMARQRILGDAPMFVQVELT